MTDSHHAHDASTVAVAVLTISSSRTHETDDSGDAIVASLERAGHDIVARDLVADHEATIRDRIEALVGREDVEAILTTGGTGLTPDDVTVEVVDPLFDRELPGFGERFRARSFDEVGPRAMLSRATAGVVGTVPVFCLPGSVDAASMGATDLVAPLLGHAVGLLQGHSHGGADHD